MRNLALITSALLLLNACSGLSDKDETLNWTVEKIYNTAREAMDDTAYDKAIKYFEKLEANYPYGIYAQQAQMELAYAHYKNNEPDEAIAACNRFIRLHPTHPNLDYIYYLQGLANWGDLGTFGKLTNQDPTERDPKAARDAFDSFKLLITKFPNSSYAPDARMRMSEIVNRLAQYEIHVADYYLRRHAYIAALNRAKTVIETYPNTPSVVSALKIMVQVYDKLNLPELRDDTMRVMQANAFTKTDSLALPR